MNRKLNALAAALAAAMAFPSSINALPVITKIVETGGDGGTATPEAKFTGETFNHPNEGANFKVPTFGEEVPSFTDRTHEWNGATTALPLPRYLTGAEYIMAGNNNRDNADLTLEITIAEESYVYLLVDNRLGDGNNANPPDFTANMSWLPEQGWLPVLNGLNRAGDASVPDEVGVDEGGNGRGPGGDIQQWSSVYMKTIPAGTFTIYQADNGGRNMYGVVVRAVPKNPFVSNSKADLFSVKFDITDGAATTLSANSIVLKVDDQTVTPQVTKNGKVTTVEYRPASQFPSASTHKAILTFSDSATPANAITEEFSFTSETYGTLTAADAVPAGSIDTSSSGFTVRVAQARDNARWPGADLPNNTLRAEEQLAGRLIDPESGQPLANYALPGPGPGGTYTAETINWNQDPAAEAGNFQSTSTPSKPDEAVPGIPGNDPESPSNIDNIAAEAVTFLELKKGLYRIGVNSDDGFRVTAGRNVRSPGATELGIFSGGRGSADSLFYVLVEADGIYPIRLIWYEGGGGANVEFFSVNATTGQKILINDRSNPAAIKAYRVSNETARPYVSASPIHLSTGVSAATKVNAQIVDQATTVANGSVKLYFNGNEVTPTVTKSGAVTSVTYDPPGLMASNSTNQVSLVFSDSGSPSSTITNSWRFVVQDYNSFPKIPAAFAVPRSAVNLDSSGFNVDIYQIESARTGFTDSNSSAAAEAQIARSLTNSATGLPYENLASPGTNPDGTHAVEVINWNQDAPGNAGSFNGGSGHEDTEIPGVPGAQDHIAGAAITYLDLKAGVYQFGVNSDDGFKVTSAANPRDVKNAVELGIFNTGRGAADSLFNFVVEQDGIYPFRLLWWEGTGGASVEFFSVDPDSGVRTLINERAKPVAIRAYRTVSAVPTRPTLNVSRGNGTLIIQWPGGGTLQSATSLTPPVTWTDVGSSGSHTEPTTGAGKYFRVRQ